MEIWPTFIEDWLLPRVLMTGALLVSLRLLAGLVALGRSSSFINMRLIAQLILPLHRLIPLKPGYWFLRAVFHLSLLIVPLFLAQHLMLWQEAGLNLELPGLPKSWAVGLSLGVLAGVIFFLGRRVAAPAVRAGSGPVDYLVLALTGLPFASGLLLANGPWPWLPRMVEDNLFTLHLLFGELFFLSLGFLVFKARLDKSACTGCASCALNCPSAALAMTEDGDSRLISYLQPGCICCANCAAICPEGAVKIRHGFSPPPLPWIFKPVELNRLPLAVCQNCGKPLAPREQLVKIKAERESEYEVGICPECRQASAAESLRTQTMAGPITANYPETKKAGLANG